MRLKLQVPQSPNHDFNTTTTTTNCTMFKKVDRSKKAQPRKTKAEESDEEDTAEAGSNDSNLLETLQATKKRRALIHQLQFKRGLDANDLLAPSSSSHHSAGTNDSSETLAVAAASSELGSNLLPDEANKSIWEKKHAAAMEDFVRNRLQSNESDDKKSGLPSDEGADATHTVSIKTNAQIYRELAAETALLGGGGGATGMDESAAAAAAAVDTSKDVLTAGAATALAEVILPVSDRLQVVKETARATSGPHHRSTRNDETPNTTSMTSIVQRIQKKNTTNNSAIPNRFRSFHNHHHPSAPPPAFGNDNGDKTPTTSTAATATLSAPDEVALDGDRLGFVAARQQQQHQQQQFNRSTVNGPSATTSNKNKTRASDDRVYQQFVKRQREQHGR
jgi:hypothetical protein